MGKDEAPRFSFRDLFSPGNGEFRGWADPPELDTERLRLRRLRMRDAKDLYSWASDPEVAKYVLWEAHRSPAETRAYLRYVKSLYRRALPSSWGIVLKESGKVIGTIGVMAWSPEHRSVEVGYSLGRNWWHQGYAPEALRCLMDFLFDSMRINRIEAQCDVQNPNSARVMEKCGMIREGMLRQRVFNKGKAVDVALYAALSSDRQKNTAGSQPAVIAEQS